MAGVDFESEVELDQLPLPISNTENKLLEAEVLSKQRDLSSHEVKISEHRDRIQGLGDHLKNVKQELQHTQVPTHHLIKALIKIIMTLVMP